MPCVIEIWPVDLQFLPTHMHHHKYCFESAPGFEGVLPGVVIEAVYINQILFQNFLIHHESGDNPDLRDPFHVRVCGQNSSRFGTEKMYQATCGRLSFGTPPPMASGIVGSPTLAKLTYGIAERV